jgi:hypothetical protein
MKKYLPGVIAFILAIGFSPFATAKRDAFLYDLYVFRLNAPPTSAGNLTATTISNGKLVYQNWVLEDVEEGLTECSIAEEKACRVAVIENYVQSSAHGIKLLAADPDSWGPKLAFPMEAETGLSVDYPCPTQYYIVSPTLEIPSVLDVRNGTVY